MFIRTSELRELDVINITDGRHIGNVCDVDFNPDTGVLRALVLDNPKEGFLWFNRSADIELSWHDVVLVGVDVILVKLPPDKTSYERTWHR